MVPRQEVALTTSLWWSLPKLFVTLLLSRMCNLQQKDVMKGCRRVSAMVWCCAAHQLVWVFKPKRAMPWSATSLSQFPPIELGRTTGMHCNQCDETWTCPQMPHQADQRSDNVPSEECGWMFVDDFVHQFNVHRSFCFVPLDIICADESIVWWYGLRGNWINIGLPMHVGIDCKLESECEAQSACCGKSGIVVCTHAVKSKSCCDRVGNGTSDANEGTCVSKELTLSWSKTNHLVFGDSFFASVQAARALCHHGFFFTGAVKTATHDFPMQHLANKENTACGQHHRVFHHATTPRDPDLLALTWCNRDQH